MENTTFDQGEINADPGMWLALIKSIADYMKEEDWWFVDGKSITFRDAKGIDSPANTVPNKC